MSTLIDLVTLLASPLLGDQIAARRARRLDRVWRESVADSALNATGVSSSTKHLAEWIGNASVFDDLATALKTNSPEDVAESLRSSLVHVHPRKDLAPQAWVTEADAIISAVLVAIFDNADPLLRAAIVSLRGQQGLLESQFEIFDKVEDIATEVTGLTLIGDELLQVSAEIRNLFEGSPSGDLPDILTDFTELDWARAIHGFRTYSLATLWSVTVVANKLEQTETDPELVNLLRDAEVWIDETISQVQRLTGPDLDQSLESFSANSLLVDVTRHAKHRARAHEWKGSVTLSMPNHDVTIASNREVLKHALQAILRNSFEYNQNNKETVQIGVETELERDHMKIVVTDNGRGIENSDLLFSTIFRSDLSIRHNPAGMGRSLRDACTSLGRVQAFLTLEPTTVGTRFAIELPLRQPVLQK